MKSVIIAFLLFGYSVSSEDPGCGEYTDAGGCGLETACDWDGSSCSYEADPTDAPEGTDTTEEADCDDDLDMRNWVVDYIGRSTQFKISDPCEDNKFIKFKMEDLTEYDTDGKKTTNKETSFASIKDWSHTPSSSDSMFTNVFEANGLSKSDATFTLKTEFFREDVDDYPNQWGNDTVTIERNSLKFSVNISNFIVTDGNYAVLCVNVMTNGAGDFSTDADNVYSSGLFEIDNEDTALCVDGTGAQTDLNVAVEDTGNNNNQINLCYTFDTCDGDIVYDPLISIMDGSPALSVVMVFVLSIVGVLFV